MFCKFQYCLFLIQGETAVAMMQLLSFHGEFLGQTWNTGSKSTVESKLEAQNDRSHGKM